MRLPPTTTDEVRQQCRETPGLARPIREQLLVWLGNLARFEFEESIRFGQPAGELVFEHAGATAELALATLAISRPVGIPAGVFAAMSRGRAGDSVLRVVTLLGQAVPSFHHSPASSASRCSRCGCADCRRAGSTGSSTSCCRRPRSRSIPSPASRVTRSCMLDVLNQDFIRTPRYDPFDQDLSKRLLGPAWSAHGDAAHLFGTDHLGRDLLSRIIHGARVTLLVALLAALGAGAVGIAPRGRAIRADRAAHPAEPAVADHRPCVLRAGEDDPAGGDDDLPRPRRAAAAADLGRHDP